MPIILSDKLELINRRPIKPRYRKSSTVITKQEALLSDETIQRIAEHVAKEIAKVLKPLLAEISLQGLAVQPSRHSTAQSSPKSEYVDMEKDYGNKQQDNVKYVLHSDDKVDKIDNIDGQLDSIASILSDKEN